MKKILILAVSLSLLTACGGTKTATAPAENTTKVESSQTNVNKTNVNNKENTGLDLQKALSSKEDAFNKYVELHPDSNVNEFSLEVNKRQNLIYFSIEGYDSENEYEVELNADDLSVIKDKTKRDRTDETQVIVSAMLSSIDSLAEDAAKEVGEGYEPVKYSLSFDDAKLILDIEFEDAKGKDLEYTYDVANNKLIEKDA